MGSDETQATQEYMEYTIGSEIVDGRIEVVVTEGPVKQTYIFRIPTVRELTKIGVRERDLRMADSTMGNGSDVGIDVVTEYVYRACALFELLLEKTSDVRLYTETKEGRPLVDSSKFGPEIDPSLLIGVYQGFEKSLNSFRKNRA